MPLPERKLIARIRGAAARASKKVRRGIGDDCAVLDIPRGHELLVTTDFSLEGVHFRREWHPAEAVGHRCLARGLSDIAAMGGEPVAAFLSLALPADFPQKWVDDFLRGVLKLAKKHNVPLAGGDTAQSPAGVLADIMVVGSARKGKAITRAGARPGDRVYVTGSLGASAAALKLLYARKKISERDFPRHFYPQPRLEVGRWLRERGVASAMIDLSDGLSVDLRHICEESGVGADLLPQAVPRAEVHGHAVDLAFALHGGEDYELLFTAPRNKRVPDRIAGVPVSRIGAITRRKKILLVNEAGQGVELKAKGWEHFR